jgi:hypothetical protein
MAIVPADRLQTIHGSVAPAGSCAGLRNPITTLMTAPIAYDLARFFFKKACGTQYSSEWP